MSWEALKSAVSAVITDNGSNEITGKILRNLLVDSVIPQLGSSEYRGIALPSTIPTNIREDVFYIATNEGTYSNFSGLSVADGITILRWRDSVWVKEVLFDLSIVNGKTEKGGYNGTAQELYNAILAINTTGAVTYQSLADLRAVSPIPANGTPAKVANDGDNNNNGYYSVVGGAWVKDASPFADVVDNEDIEKSGSALIISNRDNNGTGKRGFKVIRAGFDFSAIPVGYGNSIWEIREDFDLAGGDLILPANVKMSFKGGVIKNYGTITGDNTVIDSELVQIFDTSGAFAGSWNVKEFYPQWLGAMGDGVNDDLDAINGSLFFKNVRLKRGSYFISDTIDMSSECSLIGERGVKIIGITAANTPFISLSNNLSDVILKDFVINNTSRGNSTGFYGAINSNAANTIQSLKIINVDINISGDYNSGINFINDVGLMEDIEITGCKINCTGAFTYGINMRKQTDRLRIAGNYITLSSATSYNSIAVYANSKNFNVLNNNCYLAGHSAIAISNGIIGNVIGNNVSGVLSAVEGGIEVEWKDSHGGTEVAHDVTVVGNTIENCTYGILIMKRDAVNPDQVYNVVVNANIVKNTTNGVRVLNLDRAVISGNVIDDASTRGMYIDNCNKLTVNSNVINNANEGIDVQNSSLVVVDSNIISTTLGGLVGGAGNDRFTVTNNNFESTGNGSGVYFTSITTSFNISGNTLDFQGATSASGIRVASCDKGIIGDNFINGAVNYAIRLESNADNVEVRGNYIDNQTTSQNNGSGNRFINNRGIAQALTSGTTAQRPVFAFDGMTYFDTTLNQPIWRGGGAWVDSDGNSI